MRDYDDLVNYPFAAVEGQAEFKLALLLAAINPLVSGVLVSGPRGSAKSTLAKGLADILPQQQNPSPFITLPLGASEEMLIGTLDLQQMLDEKAAAFQPGLLAKAHNGVLYVDEVNLLADNLVDQLLDVAASGVNTVERDGVSHQHLARFILLGTMNPDEGELRPQLSDRFGLSVHLSGRYDVAERVRIVALRERFDRDPKIFIQEYNAEQLKLSEKVASARALLPQVKCPDECRIDIAQACNQANVDGLRADIVWVQAALAHAALEQRDYVTQKDVLAVKMLVLTHRCNQPSDDSTPPNPPPPFSRPPARRPQNLDADATQEDSRPDDQKGGQGARQKEGKQNDRQQEGDWGAMLPHEQKKEQAIVQSQLPPLLKTQFPQLNGMAQRLLGIRQVSNKLTGLVSGQRVSAEVGQKIDWFKTFIRSAGQWPLKGLYYRNKKVGAPIVHLVLLDTSGSVLDQQGLAKAKGLISQIAKQAYKAREAVTILGFGNQRVEMLMVAHRAPKETTALLNRIKAGGGTPLNDALREAAQWQRQFNRKNGNGHFNNYIITDGRISRIEASQPLMGETIILDIEQSAVKRGQAQQIAQALQARYLSVSY